MSISPEGNPAVKSRRKSIPPMIEMPENPAEPRAADEVRVPPPSPTYTMKQLLAYHVQLPSPTSRPSTVKIEDNDPEENSTVLGYDWILGSSLQRIRKLHVLKFRSRIETMDSVKFDQPMALPWHASPMLSAGCVAGYLDAQVLGAAWQVVLQMVPQERDYDLQMVKQASLMDATPTQTYSVLRGDKCENLAIVELKAPGAVKAMLPLIESALRGTRVEPTDGWKAVTRQLRMYAASSKVRDVLVMDECVGIYFRFPADPTQVDEVHEFLFASADREQGFGRNLRLSVRELVVFVLLSALDRNNVRLRDFGPENLSLVLFEPNTRPYHNVLSNDGLAQGTKRRAGPSADTQGKKKSGKWCESDQKPTFDKWILGASVHLTLIAEESPVTVGQPTVLDFHLHRPTNPSMPSENKPSLSPPQDVAVSVERILKKHVALVTDGVHQFVAKMFAPHADRDPELMLKRELEVYQECAPVQGMFIPYLIGVYRFATSSPRYNSRVMIIEYIGYGTTIAQLMDVARGLEEPDEITRVNNKLAVLKTSAKKAIDCLHMMRVVHGDVAGRNMLVQDDEHVVLVDFGFSMVLKDEPGKFEVRSNNDIQHLNKVFELGS